MDIFSLLDEEIPETQIRADIEAILSDSDRKVELDGEMVKIEVGVAIEIVARTIHSYRGHPIGFGDPFRVLAALGGHQGMKHGLPIAGICFSTLYYNRDHRLITIDFSRDML